jgi:hypothetical protein
MGRQGISFLKQASAGWGHRRESEAGSAFPVCDCEGSFGRGRNGRAFFYASVGGWDGRAGLRGATGFSSLRGRGRGSLAESVLLVAFTCSGRFHSGFQHLCPVSQVWLGQWRTKILGRSNPCFNIILLGRDLSNDVSNNFVRVEKTCVYPFAPNSSRIPLPKPPLIWAKSPIVPRPRSRRWREKGKSGS